VPVFSAPAPVSVPVTPEQSGATAHPREPPQRRSMISLASMLVQSALRAGLWHTHQFHLELSRAPPGTSRRPKSPASAEAQPEQRQNLKVESRAAGAMPGGPLTWPREGYVTCSCARPGTRQGWPDDQRSREGKGPLPAACLMGLSLRILVSEVGPWLGSTWPPQTPQATGPLAPRSCPGPPEGRLPQPPTALVL